jgi:hypothetical protein
MSVLAGGLGGLLPNQFALVPRFRVGANGSFVYDDVLCLKELDLALAIALADRNLHSIATLELGHRRRAGIDPFRSFERRNTRWRRCAPLG